MDITPVKRALISVSDKSGLPEFARQLVNLGVEIISTGGTSTMLNEAGIPHRMVDEVTGMPEMLDGRVKTLHPKIHGGILGKRDEHQAEAVQHQISWIDLVVVNFYPFENAVSKNQEMLWEDAIEYIDIGGPTMVRAAAKNFAFVGVVTDPEDYQQVLNELETSNGLSFETRKNFAEKAFGATSRYDAMIHHYFLKRKQGDEPCPQDLSMQFEKVTELRYGENPHQKASAYKFKNCHKGILNAIQHQGKPLSYNNILDAEAALTCVNEFSEPAAVIVKHANPCGAAIGSDIDEAYKRAYEADSLSAFGGIVALNQPCTKKIAEMITNIFMEVVIAPGFSKEALEVFSSKPNLRILEIPMYGLESWEMKYVRGGVLVQEKDKQIITADDLQVVTKLKPSADEMNAMLFAWRVLKHVKSNGILIAKQNSTIGIGAGQVSRIDAVEQAVRKAGDKINEAILASDAFFPFRDSIDKIAKTGIRAIIQPGGSVKDEEVIAACNENNLVMVFTGMRCFRH